MNSKKGMFANGKSSDPAVIRHLTGMDEGSKSLSPHCLTSLGPDDQSKSALALNRPLDHPNA
jgi:hypothetical protein